jgi:hypothetical protein
MAVLELNVLSWNVNNVAPKKYEFFDFLLENDVHIAILCETYSKPGTALSYSDFCVIGLTVLARQKAASSFWCIIAFRTH